MPDDDVRTFTSLTRTRMLSFFRKHRRVSAVARVENPSQQKRPIRTNLGQQGVTPVQTPSSSVYNFHCCTRPLSGRRGIAPKNSLIRPDPDIDIV